MPRSPLFDPRYQRNGTYPRRRLYARRAAIVAAVLLAGIAAARSAHAATTNHLTGGDWSVITSTKWPYPCVKWEAGKPAPPNTGAAR